MGNVLQHCPAEGEEPRTIAQSPHPSLVEVPRDPPPPTLKGPGVIPEWASRAQKKAGGREVERLGGMCWQENVPMDVGVMMAEATLLSELPLTLECAWNTLKV